jgi:uncharacterized protein YndB with AHSA1/START domain
MDPKDFVAGPLADVELVSDGDRPTLVFVRNLRHAPDQVWTALTDPDQLRQWAPYTADRDLGRTGPATLTMLGGDTSTELPGSVTRAEPPRVLEYTWGTDLLHWQLDASGSGTRLTLRHTVQALDWVPKVAAGWHLCLVVADHLLDGEPIGPIVGPDAMRYGWQDLHDAYAEQLGIEVTPSPSS